MGNSERQQVFKENGHKTFRVDEKGRTFIGDDEFMYPILQDSVSVSSVHGRKYHTVTMTILVGDVDMKSVPHAPINPDQEG